MQKQAEKVAAEGSTDSKKKKRKRGRDSSSSKKSKKSMAETLSKHNTKQSGSTRPIFIQPPNLADGCVLKDYQLEGVRWMASLYENGVSGTLADEM